MSTDILNMPVVQSIMSRAEDRIEDATGHRIKLTIQYSTPIEVDSVDDMIISCIKIWGTSLDYVIDKKRTQDRVVMRSVLVYMMRTKFTRLTLLKISSKIGVFDHTSVIHMFNNAKNLMSVNDALFNLYFLPVKYFLNDTQ